MYMRLSFPRVGINSRAKIFLSVAILALSGINNLSHAKSNADSLVLVELFTSQGCSSCPPADEVLEDLSKHREVLALAFHVDYWDGLGWKDTFASPAYTSRQQHYSEIRGFQVYTPQIVVEGHSDFVGSNGGSVLNAINQAHADLSYAPISLARTSTHDAEINIGQIPAINATPGGEVILVSFDTKNETNITRGENAGRKLAYYNVVRSIRKIGSWNNQAFHKTESLSTEERGRNIAVFVQGNDGTVWAIAASRVSATN
jgi:hypothetical protein